MEIEAIRERIRHFREQKGYLQRDMADLLNMTQRNYARIERGEHKILDINLLYNICKALNINLVELLMPEDYVLVDKSLVNKDKGSVAGSRQEETEMHKFIMENLKLISQMQHEFEIQNMEILDILKEKLSERNKNPVS